MAGTLAFQMRTESESVPPCKSAKIQAIARRADLARVEISAVAAPKHKNLECLNVQCAKRSRQSLKVWNCKADVNVKHWVGGRRKHQAVERRDRQLIDMLAVVMVAGGRWVVVKEAWSHRVTRHSHHLIETRRVASSILKRV
jgi:hypothetical protein